MHQYLWGVKPYSPTCKGIQNHPLTVFLDKWCGNIRSWFSESFFLVQKVMPDPYFELTKFELVYCTFYNVAHKPWNKIICKHPSLHYFGKSRFRIWRDSLVCSLITIKRQFNWKIFSTMFFSETLHILLNMKACVVSVCLCWTPAPTEGKILMAFIGV